MDKRLIIAAAIACATLFSAPRAFAQEHEVKEVNASSPRTGEKIRGPRSIKPVRVNRIRYEVRVNGTITRSDVDITVPFIPPVPQAAAAPTGAGGASDNTRDAFNAEMADAAAARARRSPEEEFINLEEAFAVLSRRRAVEIQNPIASLVAITNEAREATLRFVRNTDDMVRGPNHPQEVLGNLPARITQIDNAIARWPDRVINIFLADVDELESRINRLPTQWLVDNKSRVDLLLARLQALRESVVELSHDGGPDGPAAKFDAAQEGLRRWREIFVAARDLGASYFELPYEEEDCGFAFGQNKETKFTLFKRDRSDADAEEDEVELITVVCSSPFSVSGGFGFSTVNEREFVFVQSTKSVTENGQTTQQVVNRFGFKNNSSFRPIPLLLLNTRIREWNDRYALHISAGAGVDIKTGEAGTDVEFIVGPSVSFKRSLFLTAGVHVGRVPKLAGGFELGQEVPEGVEEPPVEKAWKPGFIFALTYKLR